MKNGSIHIVELEYHSNESDTPVHFHSWEENLSMWFGLREVGCTRETSQGCITLGFIFY